MSREPAARTAPPAGPVSSQAAVPVDRTLDGNERGKMGRAFGTSLDHLRIRDADGANIGGAGALAYNVGNRIGFAPGAYRPGTMDGDVLLAHEIAHSLQPASLDAWSAEREADEAALGTLIGRPARPQGPGGVAPQGGLELRRCNRDSERQMTEILGRQGPITGDEAKRVLETYARQSPAERRRLFDRYYASGGVQRVLRALRPEDAAGRHRDTVRELLRWAQERETRAASGMTDAEMADVQARHMQAEAEALARQRAGARAPTQAEVETARRDTVDATSIAPSAGSRWSAMTQAERDQWTADGNRAVASVVSHAGRAHPELRITTAHFHLAFEEVELRGQRVLAFGRHSGGRDVAVVGYEFVRAALANPAYVMSIVVHEVFGHPEYGPYGSEYHLTLYDAAAAKIPGYTQPSGRARTSEIDAFAYQETEIYTLLRSHPYHTPIAPEHAGQNLVSADPERLVHHRLGLIKRQWESSLAVAMVRGLYVRLRLDPRITRDALEAYARGVRANFTEAEANRILQN